ncbi:MAG: PBP1A family penicillin-binding protein [Lachnospiraceae bacterium]|nr:PBP1A family penicillin-binding protein [Lachnospiraceae bacterium]
MSNYGKNGLIQRRRQLNSLQTKFGRKASLIAFEAAVLFLTAAIIMGCACGVGIFKGILASAPDIGNIDVTPSGYSTFVYDVQGNQTAKLVSTDSNRIPVAMSQVPENLCNAFVAIEDERYYQHNGIDIKGIIRAGVNGITSGNFDQGASTITQQLIKNNVFTQWASGETFTEKVKRKIQEQYLAVELEKTMSKEDILINYMNSINLGQNTLGVQAAALRYFNKDVSTLNLSECAVIAGITQNPSRYNPISHPEKNAERRERVLNKMLDLGFITQAEYDEAINDDVYSRIQEVDTKTTDDTINSYFVDALTDDVLNDLIAIGYTETQAYTLLYSGGLKIYSTQDSDIQKICDSVCMDESNFPADTKWYLNYRLTLERANGEEENVSTEMFRNYYKGVKGSSYNLIYSSQDDAYADIEAYKADILGSGDKVVAENISMTPQPQISFTIEDQATGEVLAMVGGRGAKNASRTLNRATDTKRQPGSTFKIVSTYAPALDSAGMTLADVQIDQPYSYNNGKPVKNADGKFRGLTTLREGIRDSVNIVAVKTLTQITPQLGFEYLRNFGFTTLVESRKSSDGTVYSDIQQALALGGLTDGVTNEELNAAYACIANNGVYIKPRLYTKIVDHDGNVVVDNTEPDTRRVLKETTAWLLTSAMQDVVNAGTGVRCNFGTTAIAGKTGTTSSYNDSWFAGYTTYYTATSWAGYDNNVDLTSSDEKNLAKNIWRKCMEQIHAGLPSTHFPAAPAGIVAANVCHYSGKRPVAGLCDADLRTEYFAEGTVPQTSCDVHYQGYLCAVDGCTATEMCPFKHWGVLLKLPQEDPSVLAGSSTTVMATDENGNPVFVTAGSQTCHHNAAFFATPGYENTIAQEQAALAASGSNITADLQQAQPAAQIPQAQEGGEPVG